MTDTGIGSAEESVLADEVLELSGLTRLHWKIFEWRCAELSNGCAER